MTNNDCLRRIRYILDLSDSQIINVFAMGDLSVTRQQISAWLKKEEDPAREECSDSEFACFLNGLIVDQRGKKESTQIPQERRLNNNLVFLKLKIAFNLRAEEILEILASVGLYISKHELSAFFRRSGHKHYRACKDQVLRNFLQGLQLKYRGTAGPDENEATEFNWEQAKPVDTKLT